MIEGGESLLILEGHAELQGPKDLRIKGKRWEVAREGLDEREDTGWILPDRF